MRTQIGFKVTDNKLMVVEEPKVQPQQVQEIQELSLEQMLRLKGREQALMILNEYFDSYMYPLLSAKKRDEFFIGRLRMVKERFFTAI